MPRGARAATKTRSLNPSSEPERARATASGRTKRSKKKRNRKPGDEGLIHRGKRKVGGEQHEKQAERKQGELLLKTPQAVLFGDGAALNHQAEHHRRHDPRLFQRRFGKAIGDQDPGKRGEVFELNPNPTGLLQKPGEAEPQNPAKKPADAEPRQVAKHRLPKRRAPGVAETQHRLENRHRQDRPHRVNEDGFPFEDRPKPPGHRHPLKEGLDHGGTGDHDQRAENHRRPGRKAAKVATGKAGPKPGDRRAQGDEPAHLVKRPPQVLKPKRKRTLKKDDGHRELDKEAKPRAKGLGVEQTKPIRARGHAEK